MTDAFSQRPLAGATLMVQGTAASAPSGADIRLERLPPDNPNHAFQPAATCGRCHTDIHAQWLNSSMGRAMGEKLPQKMSLYLGQTTEGRFDGLGFGWRFFAPMMGISQGMHAMNLDHFAGACTNCHARGVTWKKGVLEPPSSAGASRTALPGSIRAARPRARPLWRAAWMNLSDAQRGVRMAAGTMMIFVAAVVPAAFAIQLWPVGGFAAERVLYDTRLDYREADATVYRFRAPAGAAQVKARLVYLRHWYFMEPIKGPAFWSTDQWKYLLHEVSLAAPAGAKGMRWTDASNHEGSLADMPPVPAEPGAGRWVDAADAKQCVATRDGS
ncbi:MAG: hypothetical protein U5L05_15875 [Rubrivivax sp.]|nr:hypothetical protein [Rubrivivax sp.]